MQDSFFNFFDDSVSLYVDDFGEVIKDDLWNNPMQYYFASEMDNEEVEKEEDLNKKINNLQIWSKNQKFISCVSNYCQE